MFTNDFLKLPFIPFVKCPVQIKKNFRSDPQSRFSVISDRSEPFWEFLPAKNFANGSSFLRHSTIQA